MEGLLTEIERFALNDGPGIRTTVFFKGCNMKCSWCHNPETINPGRELLYYSSKCIGCYKCVYACPSKAQKKINNIHIYYPNICVRCGKCASICYAGAMAMCGKKYTVEDVMKEVRQDKAYYDSSNGGGTLSGGEVLCQKDFAKELIKACHEENISVGIETNLNFPWDGIKDVVGSVDLVMCDIKLIDSSEHREHTGAGNEQILENARRLAGTDSDVLFRMPFVPEYNDGEAEKTAAFVHGLGRQLELMAYHNIGESKCRALGRKSSTGAGVPPSPEFMRETADKLRVKFEYSGW